MPNRVSIRRGRFSLLLSVLFLTAPAASGAAPGDYTPTYRHGVHPFGGLVIGIPDLAHMENRALGVSDRGSGAGFGASVLYGFSQRNALGIDMSVLIRRSEYFDVTTGYNYAGLAWRHYFSERPSSFFVTAGGGILWAEDLSWDWCIFCGGGSASVPDEPGGAVSMGVGIELSERIQVRLDVVKGSSSDGHGTTYDYDQATLQIAGTR